MPPPIYTKLSRRNRGRSGYSQLWRADDHILLLTSTRFVEEYQRFSFADVQAIVITQVAPRIVFQVILILAALLWLSLSFVVDSAFAKWAIGAIGAFVLLLAVVDIARGPRCRCYLHTRVTKQLLAPISRMKTAHAFLVAIRPAIEAVQGVLPVEALAVETSPPVWEAPPPELVTSPGYVPEVLFATFLIDAALIWAAIHYPKIQEISGLLMSTLLAEVTLVIVALLRRRGRDARIVTYAIAAVAIIGILYDVSTVAREVVGWYMALLDRAKNGDRSAHPLLIFAAGGKEPFIAVYWRIAAGLAGLAAAFLERRKPAR